MLVASRQESIIIIKQENLPMDGSQSVFTTHPTLNHFPVRERAPIGSLGSTMSADILQHSPEKWSHARREENLSLCNPAFKIRGIKDPENPSITWGTDTPVTTDKQGRAATPETPLSRPSTIHPAVIRLHVSGVMPSVPIPPLAWR